MSLMNDDPDADDEYGDVHTLTMNVASRTVAGRQATWARASRRSRTTTRTWSPAPSSRAGWTAPGAAWTRRSPSGTATGTTLVATNALPSGHAGHAAEPLVGRQDARLRRAGPRQRARARSRRPGGTPLHGRLPLVGGFNATTGALTGYARIPHGDRRAELLLPGPVGRRELGRLQRERRQLGRQQRRRLLLQPPGAREDHALPAAERRSAARPAEAQRGRRPHELVAALEPGAARATTATPILWVTFSSNRDYGLHSRTAGFDNYYPPESPSYDQPQPASKQDITFDNYAAPQIWMAAIIVDPNRSLDSTDRSYPAFWLPFQDVTAHNHSAQWVAQVQSGGPGPDGGIGDGGNAGDGAPACGEAGATCGIGAGLCCSDVVCCAERLRDELRAMISAHRASSRSAPLTGRRDPTTRRAFPRTWSRCRACRPQRWASC